MSVIIFAASLTVLILTILLYKIRDKKTKIITMSVFPAFALIIYLFLGSPDMPSQSALFETSGPRAVQRALVKKELVLMKDLAAEPESVPLMLSLGSTRLRNGRIEEAIAVLQLANKSEPDNKDILTELGAAHYAAALSLLILDENNRDQARDYFDKALEIAPADAPYRARLIEDMKRF